MWTLCSREELLVRRSTPSSVPSNTARSISPKPCCFVLRRNVSRLPKISSGLPQNFRVLAAAARETGSNKRGFRPYGFPWRAEAYINI